MFAKFQFRFLINALVAVGILYGISHPVFAQYSEHSHSGCEHSHAGHDHEDSDHEDDSSDHHNNCDDGTCLMCGFSMTTTLSAPIAFRAPTFTLFQISEGVNQKLPVPVAQGIYHPPQG